MIVVTAAGNSGDAYFVVGSPGNAGRAIAVAAVGDPGVTYGDLRVNSPAGIAGDYSAEPALFGPASAGDPDHRHRGLCVPERRLHGADQYERGCRQRRPDGPRATCNFTVKVKNAQLAGAVAAIVADNVSESFLVIMSGSDPTITIPSFFISLADGQTLEGQLPTPGINATLIGLNMADTMAYFSSRGPRSGDALLKPDIAAPGLADLLGGRPGRGTPGVSMDGTSMATPHVSGAMALLRQLHPTWTVEELKALAMNTAADDVTVNPNAVPPHRRHGENRRGPHRRGGRRGGTGGRVRRGRRRGRQRVVRGGRGVGDGNGDQEHHGREQVRRVADVRARLCAVCGGAGRVVLLPQRDERHGWAQRLGDVPRAAHRERGRHAAHDGPEHQHNVGGPPAVLALRGGWLRHADALLGRRAAGARVRGRPADLDDDGAGLDRGVVGQLGRRDGQPRRTGDLDRDGVPRRTSFRW